VREVEQYQLDRVGITSLHSTGSGTKLLEKGWTLFFSGVAHGERRRVGVGILTSPLQGLQLWFALMHRTAVHSIQPSWSW